jgi:site-specific recombinase XerD
MLQHSYRAPPRSACYASRTRRTNQGFHRLIHRVSEAAEMTFPINPHVLRRVANDGHDTQALQHYLGHKNIQHTVRYTEMAPDRFKDFWRGY